MFDDGGLTEQLLPEDASESTEQNTNDHTASEAAPRLTSSFFDETEVVNGVPICRLEPFRTDGRFRSHAFSSDGSRMATGESDGTVRLWDTRDYMMLEQASTLFNEPISCLSFVDRKNDRLIGVDKSGFCSEFSITLTEDIAGPSSGGSERFKIKERQLVEYDVHGKLLDFVSGQFGKDGRVLLCTWGQLESQVQIYQLQDNVQYSLDLGQILVLSLYGTLDRDLYRALDRDLDRALYQALDQALDRDLYGTLDRNRDLDRALNHDLNLDLDLDLQRALSPVGFFAVSLLSERGSHILVTAGFLLHNVICTAVCAVEDLPIRTQADWIVFIKARGFWGKHGEYLLLWKDENGDCPMLEVHPTGGLSKNSKGFQRRLEQGLLKWNAHMIDGKDVFVAIYTVADSGKQRIQLWDCVLDAVRNDVILDLTPCRVIDESASTSNGNTADDIIESVGQPKSTAEFIERVMEDVHPKFCVSRDRAWLTVFSWRLHTWTVCSLSSSLTVWNVGIPQDVTFDPFRMRNRVMFDPSEHRLLLLGDATIFTALSPGSLNFRRRDHKRFEFLSADSRDVSANPVNMLVCLPSKALAKLASMLITRRHLHIECTDQPMQIQSISDVACSQLDQQIAIVANAGNRLVFLTGSKIEFSDALRGRSEWKAKRFAHCLTECDPGKVYMYFDDEGNESLVVRPDGSNPLASFCNLNEESSVFVDLGIRTVHEVTQTEDRRKLLMLNDDGVSVVDLWQQKTVEHIGYAVNFSSVADERRANCRWWHPHFQEGEEMTERRISEDGRAVLVAWDTKNKKSIIVKPTTSYEECRAMIADADGSLSDYCLLSRYAEVTLFVDTDALLEDLNEFVVAVRRVTKYIDLKNLGGPVYDWEALRILNNVFYDLTPDGATFATMVALVDHQPPMKSRIETNLCIETFGVNCSEYAISSYPQLVSQPNFNPRASAQECRAHSLLLASACTCRLFEQFGASSFDIIGNKGSTIFQEAVFHQHWDFMKALQDVALKNNIQLSFYQSNSAAEHKFVGLLRELFSSESTNDIRMAIEVICSKTTPFDQVVEGMTLAFNILPLKHPDIVKTVLSKDYLKRRMCLLDVHVKFLDAKLRQDTAVHIGTLDEYQDWITIEDPTLLQQRFRTENEKAVGEMEKTGNRSTTKAALIYVCIKNAAKVGMEGIIRPLLMQNAQSYIFKLDVVKWLIMYKWLKIWKPRSIKQILFYCFFLLTFTIYVLLLGRSDALSQQPERMKILSTVVLSISFIFGCRMLKEEVTQAKTFIKEGLDKGHGWEWGLRYHFLSRWNWVDLVSCLMLTVVLPLFHGLTLSEINVEEALSAFVAIESIVASFKLWYFAQPFRGTGALVLMVNNVIFDCLAFLLLTFLVLFGFALALYVLYRHAVKEGEHAEEVYDAFGTFGNSLLTLFYAMLGNFEPDVIRSAGNLFWLVIAIFAMFLATEMIVLINLLIALMGDTFDRVKSIEEDQLLLGRAIFIDSCEAALSTSEIEALNKEIGSYVWALMPLDEEAETDPGHEWMGRMTMLKTSFESAIKEGMQKLREWMKQQMQQPEVKLETMSSELVGMTEMIASNGTRVGELEATNEAMSRMLTDMITSNGTRLGELEARNEAISNALSEMANSTGTHFRELEVKIEEMNRRNIDQFEVIKSLLERRQDS